MTATADVALKHSLIEFGDLGGIVWNARSGRLISGHQRVRTLREQYGSGLALTRGAIVTPDGEKFPVRVVDWDEIKESAAILAANNPEAQGRFTADLGEMIAGLQAAAPDLASDMRLAELMASLAAQPMPAAMSDDDDDDDAEPSPRGKTSYIMCPHCGGKILADRSSD